MKKVISIIITLTLLLSVLSVSVVVHAATEEKICGDYKYTADGGKAVITGYTGSEKEVNIPSELDGITVAALGEKAFNNNKSIEKVTLPDTITEIGSGAFMYCQKLSEVNIPESVKRINNFAFCGTKIPEAVVPTATALIGKEAFAHCGNLKKITIKSE